MGERTPIPYPPSPIPQDLVASPGAPGDHGAAGGMAALRAVLSDVSLAGWRQAAADRTADSVHADAHDWLCDLGKNAAAHLPDHLWPGPGAAGGLSNRAEPADYILGRAAAGAC